MYRKDILEENLNIGWWIQKFGQFLSATIIMVRVKNNKLIDTNQNIFCFLIDAKKIKIMQYKTATISPISIKF